MILKPQSLMALGGTTRTLGYKTKDKNMTIMTLEELENLEQTIRQLTATAEYCNYRGEYYQGQADAYTVVLDMIQEYLL